MTAAADMDSRVVYQVDAGLWTHGTAILLDDGSFPTTRIGDVAALAESVLVVGDRGAADALRAAGVGSVAVADGTDLRDALQHTAGADAPIVFCGVPKKPDKAILSAISAITDPTGTQLPVAAVMFLREKAPGGGPLCPLAEQSFVSGYGALFSIMLAAKTGQAIRIVTPRADRLKATHADVVATAIELARSSGTRIEVVTDPAPRSWAVDHSNELSAVFCGVLQARGHSAPGGSKIARKSGDEAATAVHLLQEAACDVVVVLDRVSLVHGPTAGATVAKAIGAAMMAAVAVGGVAGPAAAATAPPPISHIVSQIPKTATSRKSVDGLTDAQGGSTTADQTAAADQTTAADYSATTDQTGTATDPGATDQTATTTDQTGTTTDPGTTDQTATGDASSGADTDQVAVDQPDGTTDEVDSTQSDIETPQEYIAFQIWTDSHGQTHVISTGLQDHWVDTPSLPDWAIADGGDHPWLAKRDPNYVSPESIAAQQAAHQESTGGNTTKAQHSTTGPSKAKRHSKGKHTSSKRQGGKKAGKHKAGKKSGKHGKSGNRGTKARNRSDTKG